MTVVTVRGEELRSTLSHEDRVALGPFLVRQRGTLKWQWPVRRPLPALGEVWPVPSPTGRARPCSAPDCIQGHLCSLQPVVGQQGHGVTWASVPQPTQHLEVAWSRDSGPIATALQQQVCPCHGPSLALPPGL